MKKKKYDTQLALHARREGSTSTFAGRNYIGPTFA
jgi:hypothetical protein